MRYRMEWTTSGGFFFFARKIAPQPGTIPVERLSKERPLCKVGALSGRSEASKAGPLCQVGPGGSLSERSGSGRSATGRGKRGADSRRGLRHRWTSVALGVVLFCTAVRATDYTWTGSTAGVDDLWNDEDHWTPDPGFPDCCNDEAIVGDVRDDGEYTEIHLVAGLAAKAVQQITITSMVDESGQQARFLDGDDSNPGVKCEVLVVDATNLDYDFEVKISGGAKIETMENCICTP
ncbi:MAG: hypothetical protein KJ057_03025 [Phycisphaerae bacterium]|nr:MAG: hypothetical protein EDS66_01910 [Planctomycetota bacterium]KAB2937041.1 MAG: hypothetical protein F9K17_16400 [Phycisphaerae bacterium]MBE7457623.1 hypothetical protein [Planctomycetia bacterium]MCK6463860.1 hypothetical protein [Phycisphaerae bacterium]MCL4717425.1 hypothetical protein [Phycisphaerae bacterium]